MLQSDHGSILALVVDLHEKKKGNNNNMIRPLLFVNLEDPGACLIREEVREKMDERVWDRETGGTSNSSSSRYSNF